MADIKPSQTLVYKTVGKLQIPLDIYLSKDTKNAPVLLWFHGGGLLQGRRDSMAPHMRKAVQQYGLAVISADYRLAPQVGVAEILEDVKDCIYYIRTDLQGQLDQKDAVDVSRLAVSGSSAGGYLALLAGLYVDPKPNVLAPIYPITDPLGSFCTTSQTLRKMTMLIQSSHNTPTLADGQILSLRRGDGALRRHKRRRGCQLWSVWGRRTFEHVFRLLHRTSDPQRCTDYSSGMSICSAKPT